MDSMRFTNLDTIWFKGALVNVPKSLIVVFMHVLGSGSEEGNAQEQHVLLYIQRGVDSGCAWMWTICVEIKVEVKERVQEG